MRRNRTRRMAAMGMVVAAGGGLCPALPASAAPSVTVVAGRRNNPQQMAFGPDGALYVAEAGTGGAKCFDEGDGDSICVGLTGSVTRITGLGTGGPVRVSRPQTGLLSGANPDGSFAAGVMSVAYLDRGDYAGLYGVAVSIGEPPAPGRPAGVVAQAGNVLRLKGGTATAKVADVDHVEYTQDPDHAGADSRPYGIVAQGDGFFVADQGGNTILRVEKQAATVVAVLPHEAPSSLAIGPDGALYVGTIAFEGGNGAAHVWRIRPGHAPEIAYSGFTAIGAIAFGPDRSLYVAEILTDLESESGEGDIVRVFPGGFRRRLGGHALHFVTGVAVARDGSVYASVNGFFPGDGTPSGQVVRVAG